MGIPLKNLLKVGGLRECKVVAGHSGIDNLVTNVTVMEVPDIVNWLKGNELLLTSLYPIKDDLEAQIQLIEKLYDVGTTALAIKPIRFIDAIPEEMIEKADQFGITLIEIPREISYLDILSPAMNAIFNEKVVLQEDLEQATKLLNEISIANSDFNQFINTLSFLTKSKVLLESHVPFIQVSNQEKCLLPMTAGQLKELEVLRRPVRMIRQNLAHYDESCIVAPIVIDGKLYGTITCWSYNFEFMEVDLAIQEKAASLLSLEFLRKKVRYDIEQQYKNDFLRDLLFNQEVNPQDLVERGKTYGLKEKESYLCIIMSEIEKSNIDLFSKYLSEIEAVIRGMESEVMVGTIRNSVLLFLPRKNRSDQELNKIIERIPKLIEQSVQVRIRLGIGSENKGVRGLRSSFHEAEKAITLGSKLWNQQLIIYFSHLGVYRLIALIENKHELKHFYNESIMKLVAYDEENELALIPTLEQYFTCNESIKETANQLFIHVNTLKYRLQKIKQITGLSLQNSEDKLILQMGLKIHQYNSVIVGRDEIINDLSSI
jgi:PucR family transcriptional regulator, purine catabolism regulatory protein